MRQKTTSLDIQSGKGSILDIAQIFPMTSTRTLDLARHGKFIDGVLKWEHIYRKINLSIQATLCINRFSTLEMLDIALPEVIEPVRSNRQIASNSRRPRLIDLVPPLTIPYGAIDVRMEQIIPPHHTYPDLFARKLPYWLLARRLAKGARTLYMRHRKRTFLVLMACIIFSVPTLSYVVYALSHGYSTLEHLTDTRDINQVRSMIRSARGDFERSSFLLSPFSWIPVDQIDTVRRATAWGLALTRGLDILMQSLPNATNSSGAVIKKEAQDPLSYRTASRDIFFMESLGIANPTDWIHDHQGILEETRDELMTAGALYDGVVVTGMRTTQLQKIGQTITRLAGILDWALKNQKDILNMLGHTNPQRYIVFNQNRDEIRANGGFPGSILSFTLYKGNVLDYHGDDVYYYDWNLYPYKEIPPPGIALLTDSYGLRDVNYYPDFRDTLDKANSFIERSGDATVTTGIAIHQGIIEDILAKIWPVSVSGVTLPFDEKNFSLLMSTLVENKYAKEHSPKDILFRFVTAFIAKIHEKNAPLELLDTMQSYLDNGEILFASRDTQIDSFLDTYKKKLPWQLSSPNWIYPLWTSVSGNKSDRYMNRTYQSKTRKLDRCIYENTITLETKHTFAKSDSEELIKYFNTFGITDPLERTKLDFIQWNGKNRAYVRVFVPLGALLIGAGSDIAVTSNDTATVFSTLIETPVGGSSSKSWKYTLDIPNCANYDGKVQWTRQPGLREVNMK